MKRGNVFISHHGKDDEHIGKLKDLLEKRNYQLRNSSVDSTKPNEAKNEEYIKKMLRDRIEWAGTVVCLIGDKTATREWVEWEIEEAAKQGKRIVGVFVHGSSDADVPECLNDHANAIVCWNSDKIIDAINGNNNFENSNGAPRNPVNDLPRGDC